MPESLLSLEKVSVAYGSRRVVTDVDLDGQAGEVLGVLGPNGAGKSSLLKALIALVTYTGSIRIEGEDIGTWSQLKRARHLAYVPQKSELAAPLTAEQVVSLGRYACSSSRAESADCVQKALREAGVESLAGRLFTRLSGGEQRMVLIARALATEAPILLLDEPTASLDLAHALSTLTLLRNLAAKGRCVILVLHDIREARMACDRIALMQAGSLVQLGRPERCLTAEPLLSVYGVCVQEGKAPDFRLPDTFGSTA